jgi:hypothetical protein
LLFRRQPYHPPLIIGITEGGEDALADPEIGMPLMRTFDRSRESERHAAETA